MIRQAILCLSIIVLCGCGSTLVLDRSVDDGRMLVAKSLENQQRYADTLIQWKILHTAFPNDELIVDNLNRIESLISGRLIELFEALDKAKDKGSEQHVREIYLRILALQPNNRVAIAELRQFEWENALAKAVTKTESIKTYFVETQTKAKRSIQLNDFLEQGEQFTHDKKYNGLLKLADKFEVIYPEHNKPYEYRMLAYTKLAESSLQKNNIEQAIELFDKVIQIDESPNSAVKEKNDKLKSQVSKKYLTKGLKIFKKDLDKAIEWFELSLKFQPDNKAARQQLQRATKVRTNLNKIKKLNASSS